MQQGNSDNRFIWQGIDKHGHIVSGEMMAFNRQEVKLRLNLAKIRVKKIIKIKRRRHNLKTADIILLTRQLATLLRAGIPILQSLDIIMASLNKTAGQNLVIALKTDLNKGFSLAEALRTHPRYFDELYCNLVEAAEVSGNLDLMLERIANYLEQLQKIKIKLKNILIYPSIVLVTALISLTLVLYYVMPQFTPLFAASHTPLPLMTVIVIAISDFLRLNFWWLLFSLASCGAGLNYVLNNNSNLQLWRDCLMLKLPFWGLLIKKVVHIRWAKTAATLLAAGIDIIRTLEIVAKISGNKVYARATQQICCQLKGGQSLTAALHETDIFLPLLQQLTAIGEQSGNLADMLAQSAQIYDDEVDTMINNLQTILEPLAMIFTALIVGAVVLAIYLPLIDIGNAI